MKKLAQAQNKVVIVGAGLSGIATAIRLKQEGIEDFVVLERAEDVGGTWHYNSYPGCMCDVPSHLYSLSFAPNPGWSHTYSPQLGCKRILPSNRCYPALGEANVELVTAGIKEIHAHSIVDVIGVEREVDAIIFDTHGTRA